MDSHYRDQIDERDEDMDDGVDQEATEMGNSRSMDMKMRRRFYQQHEPERVKIAEVSDKEATMPSTAEQIETLEAINEYN